MAFRLLAAPVETPVLLAEAKKHLRVDHTDDDALIQGYVDAATQQIDGPRGLLGQALMSQRWAWTLDYAFPCGTEITVPMTPLISVDAVTYVEDVAGDTVTIDEADYRVILERSLIAPVHGGAWPSPRCQRDAITVEFTAGYANAAAVPAPIKAAILLKTEQLYARREATAAEERAIENLLSPYRRWWT